MSVLQMRDLADSFGMGLGRLLVVEAVVLASVSASWFQEFLCALIPKKGCLARSSVEG